MIFKSLRFGGIDTKGFDVFISGDAVYNSPSRDVEMFEIPGRNGAFALDKGRFSNIQLSYPSGIGTKNEAEFREKIEGLRNALSSKVGYQRLEDDYHGEEFRMAVYKGGLDVNPTMLMAGQFEIVFDCKPQRFLKSGEIEQSVTSGDTITNPTLFESHPLLLVDGYGDININDDVISIQQGAVMGRTVVAQGKTANTLQMEVNPQKLYLTGNTLTVAAGSYSWVDVALQNNVRFSSINVTSVTDGYRVLLDTTMSDHYFSFGIEKEEEMSANAGSTFYTTGSATIEVTTTTQVTTTISIDFTIYYDGNADKFMLIDALNYSHIDGVVDRITPGTMHSSQITADSTKSALGQLYIDLDIGECYRIENGQIISINTATTLPAELPTLKPGDNIITYDNTFTSFKITSRWWRV